MCFALYRIIFYCEGVKEMKGTLLLILLTLLVATFAELQNTRSFDDIINYVNNANTTWKAGHNFHPSVKPSDLKYLLGAEKSKDLSKLPLTRLGLDNKTSLDFKIAQEHFDARDNWPHCASIREIHDQGACGSCWAVAVADAFTDSLCIYYEGYWQRNKHISIQNLLACCPYCGNCSFGYPGEAWLYLFNVGAVTGGYYKSREGCQPYTIQPCEHHVKGTRPNCKDLRPVRTPECIKKCDTTKIHYENDITLVRTYVQTLVPYATQSFISEKGPMTAVFRVFEDFPAYKSGVYQHTTGGYLGGLVVRIIGWGVLDGVPYWLCANSFNTDWGDKGYFKIRRGNNECGIEEYVFGGLPYHWDP